MTQTRPIDRTTDHTTEHAPSRDAERWSQSFSIEPDDDPGLARAVRAVARRDADLSSALYTMRPADQSLQLVLVADDESDLDGLGTRLERLIAAERPEVSISPLRRRRTS